MESSSSTLSMQIIIFQTYGHGNEAGWTGHCSMNITLATYSLDILSKSLYLVLNRGFTYISGLPHNSPLTDGLPTLQNVQHRIVLHSLQAQQLEPP